MENGLIVVLVLHLASWGGKEGGAWMRIMGCRLCWDVHRWVVELLLLRVAICRSKTSETRWYASVLHGGVGPVLRGVVVVGLGALGGVVELFDWK